jgi:hypothetical protein
MFGILADHVYANKFKNQLHDKQYGNKAKLFISTKYGNHIWTTKHAPDCKYNMLTLYKLNTKLLTSTKQVSNNEIDSIIYSDPFNKKINIDPMPLFMLGFMLIQLYTFFKFNVTNHNNL